MVHQFTWLIRVIEALAGGASLALANVYLVERRGRKEELNPTRQIELGTLLESMRDAVVIVDTSQRVIDVNPVAAQLLGSPRARLRGANLNEVGKWLLKENSSAVMRLQRRIVERALAGEVVREERRVIRHPKTSKEIELLISANPICDKAGQPVGALLIARDITELTQLQGRFSDMERHLAIGQVAAGIAHDFNNALETIGHAVVLLQESPEPTAPESQALLKMIQNAVEHGTEISARISDYVRSGTGELSTVNMRTLLEDAIEWTEHLRHRRHRVQLVRVLDEVPPVRANAADLRRVFTNLIINALQAMPDGGQLTVGSRTEGSTVHVWVRDTGAGISEEDQKKLFLPYFTTKQGGTGLGLSGAQKIILGLGGDVRFQSERGKGTQFDIYLPAAEAQLKSA